MCTLFEGDYDIGVAALLNSLHESGFGGVVACGFRGTRPRWSDRLEEWAPLQVDLHELSTDRHFTAYKPAMMRRCLGRYAPARVYYIDPDIVVDAPWSLLQTWATGGVALVEDVFGSPRPFDPQRLQWRRHLAQARVPVRREVGDYYNAGFVGLDASCAEFLDTWERMLELAEDVVGAIGMKAGRPTDLFFTPDQDAMNMALEACEVPVHGAPRSAMGFDGWGPMMVPHAVGNPKPWHRKVLREALRARPPSRGHRAFLKYAGAPVPALPPATLRRLRVQTKAAGLVARFYRRGD